MTASVGIAAPHATSGRERVLVIACGAIAAELAGIARLDGPVSIEITCLPASLHDTPDAIPERVRSRIRSERADGDHDRIVVGYADCGTGGLLDRVCVEEDVERLPGAHCYELFAGSDAFAALHDEAPGTFYLTDFLVRNFERLVIGNLGIDRHPQLLETYFGNYTRVVYLRQRGDDELLGAARRAAQRLRLPLEVVDTGLTTFGTTVTRVASARLPVVAA